MRNTALRTFLAVIALTGLLAIPGAVRAQVIYDNPFPDTDWLSLETEHYRIYYYPEVEWTAKMMAKYAEIAYPKVTGLFNYPLKEKIHIVIRDQEDYSNGWAAYSIDQITAWATPSYYVLRGRQEWIPDMFTHEFSHIVSLKTNDYKSESAWLAIGQGLVEDGVHNIDFGLQLLIMDSEPMWWAEGIAEYGTHMSGFNWWTTARDMVQRMSMLEDNYLEYEEMFEISSVSSSFDRERVYQQGYTVGLYVMEKYGKEAYAQLGVNSGKKGHLMWEKNIEEVLGVDGQKLFDGYIKWMKDRYKRQIQPIKDNERKGFSFLGDTAEGTYITVEEKLPDNVQKVRVRGETCLPRELEEPDNLTRLSDLLYPGNPEMARKFAKLPPMEKAQAIEKALEDNPEFETKFNETFEEILENYTVSKPKTAYWNKKERKQKLEADGQFNGFPKTSPDGKWLGHSVYRGIAIYPVTLSELPRFSGYCLTRDRLEEIAEETKQIRDADGGYGFSFSPDSKKVLFSSRSCPHTWLPCVTLDGYRRLDLYEYDLETEDTERLSRRLRTMFSSYSPDGKSIAFVHIEDGQFHLGVFPSKARGVTIQGECEIDGQPQKNCIKWLIKKHDGTILGVPSWSPDGKQIVIDLYRNRQQDVWIVNADGSGLRPLTWDRAEDRDGQFTPDGKNVLYSSDRSGIFNVYQMNLDSGEVKQLTNVIGGVYTPHMTSDGDLLYSYFTSYGFKIYAHRRENFFNKAIDAGYEIDPQEVARNLGHQEPLPEIKESSESYNPFHPKNWAPPSGIPLLIYEQKGLQLGAVIQLFDALGKHALFSQVLLGQRSVYYVSYWNNFWYPNFRLGFAHLDLAYEFAQGFGSSALISGTRSEPHFDPPGNYKNRQGLEFAWAAMDYSLMPQLQATLAYNYMHATSKRSSGGKEEAFLTRNSYELTLEYEDLFYRRYGERDINPSGGRRVTFSYLFNRTGLPTKDWADVEWLGRTNPPGDNSDDYTFHELQIGYTEYIPVSWWNKDGNHTLELHMRGGWVNRNVYRWDEFFAGSLHPLSYVPRQSSTNEFSGYEDYSLAGETMLIFGLTYRFPFARHIDKKFGPFYFVSVWGEFSATAGNLWGYTAEYVYDKFGNIDRNAETYWDPEVKPGTVRREIPFVDIASKNGNYLLYDVSFTLKLKAFIFGTTRWNSFIRVSYGLNDIIGQYEVNDDYAFVDAYPNNALYAESEPRTLRLSIGIGSDFE